MGKDQSSRKDQTTQTGKKSDAPSGGARDRPDVSKQDQAQKTGRKGESKKDSDRAPKGSKDYPKDPKSRSKTDWKKERRRHTKNAERKARREAKKATGKDVKIAGKKVQWHHHAGVRDSKRAGLDPKVAGETKRMTAVHSRRDKKVYGTAGDKVDPKKNKRYTHHNIADKIDKAEQRRAAKAMGGKGDSPRLPRGPKGRAGMIDASATGKWRFPATGDQAERSKMKWERKEPAGPKVGKDGRVVPNAKESAPKTSPSSGKADVPKTPDKPKISGKPEPGGIGKALKGLGKALEVAGKAAKVGGALGNAANFSGDAIQSIAKYKPELLPEGAKVELNREVEGVEVMSRPSGYTVEKTNGQVIYRDSNGTQVDRDEAMRATESNYGGKA